MPVPQTTMAEPRRLLRDEVYFALLDAIVSGTLAPGERLRDEAIEEWAGASRTPIRDAIARLGSIGLIEVLPQRQTRVAALDADSFAEAVAVLGALYSHAVRESIPLLTPRDRIVLESYLVDVLGDIPTPGVSRIPDFTALFAIFLHRYGNSAITKLTESVSPHVRRGINAIGDRTSIAVDAGEATLRELVEAALDANVEAATELTRYYFSTDAPNLVAALRVTLSEKGSI